MDIGFAYNMFSDYPDIMTFDEACTAMRMGSNAMYNILNAGKLKGIRNGRIWLIPKPALIEFVMTSMG